ncbi:rhomboid-like protein [Streptomyces niveiscabiei]|uniref:rhomboid-like protein n=1 Tax=Streptomyces niveiscabiei TaxID=164115 RepID=UPI0006EB7C9C|nr:rhomboid-like protein [Streptomyces niveiscabiei]
MERTETAEAGELSVPGALLDGVPRQRLRAGVEAAGGAEPAVVSGAVDPVPVPVPVPVVGAADPVRCAGAVEPVPGVGDVPVRVFPRMWRLLPTPTGTPFTFWYAVLLAVTSYVADNADPSWVDDVLQASSTDVTHLVQAPVLVLLASAAWVAGGLGSPFVAVFLLVLTALERRIGGPRTALVFLAGHVVATLATELPVGFAVLVGELPDSSLHRFDYGISFGVAASLGAVTGLLRPWVRWPVLVLFGGTLLQDLVNMTDPVSNWGHLIALGVGVGMWRWVRRWSTGGVRRTALAV